MNKGEIFQILQEFNIEIPAGYNDTTKKEMLIILEEHGITKDSYRELLDKDDIPLPSAEESYEDDIVRDQAGDRVLVGMNRKNSFFQYKNYKFDKQNNFIPMSKEDADDLIANYEGFYFATRRDIKSYYK